MPFPFDIARRGWWSALGGLLLLALAACAAAEREAPPNLSMVDGVLYAATPQSRFAVTVPPGMVEVTRQIGRAASGAETTFRRELGERHTIVAAVGIQTIAPEDWRALKPLLAASTDAQVLGQLVERLEQDERASPGRTGSVLLNYRHLGGALPPHANLGLACAERSFEAEDREVPGEGDRLFHLHLRGYTCLDPRSRWPVDLKWSERYPADGGELSPSFAADATAFFESLRFSDPAAPPDP